MCHTPFQVLKTILFNPHDISDREVILLFIFHKGLRLGYVKKIVQGGVHANIHFVIHCTI